MDRLDEKAARSRGPSALLIALLALSLLVSLVLLPARQVLFNADNYRPMLQALDASGDLTQVGTLMLNGAGGSVQNMAGTSQMNNAQLAQVQGALIPAGWVQDQALGLLNGLFAYVNWGSAQFEPVVSFEPVRQSLLANADAVANRLLDSSPACSAQDALRFAEGLLTSGNAQPPLCNPPAAIRPVLTAWLAGQLGQFANSLPPQITLTSLGAANGQSPALAAFTQGVSTARLLSGLLDLVALLAIALLVAAFVGRGRSLRRAFLWVGISLAISGGLAVLVSTLAGNLNVTQFLASLTQGSQANAALQTLLGHASPYFEAVWVQAWRASSLWSLGALGLGALTALAAALIGG